MGKAEEAAAKRRTKAARKRLRRTSGISASLQAHIAAKRRRKDGKRRNCQGMCYTLPTPEDPFNDRSARRGKKRKIDGKEPRTSRNAEQDRDRDESADDEDEQLVEEEEVEVEEDELVEQIRRAPNGPEICRELMVEKLLQGGVVKNISSTKATRFDRQFWKACSSGRDVIGTGDELSRLSYVAFAACQIAKTSHRKKKPLVLIIVVSQEEARAVRRICVAFHTDLGIQTVSIHSGTPIEHQVEGLKLLSPEIVVATPERLCELQAQTAIDISEVTYLVVENLERLISANLSSSLSDVKQRINPAAQCVVLSEAFSLAAIELTRQLVGEPVIRVEAGRSLKDKAACIAQEVSVIVDSAKRLPKLLNIVKSSADSTLVLINKNEDANQLASSIVGVKARALVDAKDTNLARNFSDGSLKALVTTEEMLGLIDARKVHCLVWYSFPPRIETYCDLLTRLARCSAHGVVYSFCGGSVAPLSSKLVNVLEQCSQPVPSALDMLAKAAAAISQHSS